MSASAEAAANQQQQEMQQDVERVVELASQHLSPNDQALLRWATGLDEKPRRSQWWDLACDIARSGMHG